MMEDRGVTITLSAEAAWSLLFLLRREVTRMGELSEESASLGLNNISTAQVNNSNHFEAIHKAFETAIEKS